MKKNVKKDDISIYIEDREFIANTYVMRCFSISIFVYTITYILNLLGVFVIDGDVMRSGFIPSMLTYIAVYFVSKFMSLSNEKTKYLILFSTIMAYTIMGVSITYHVVLVSLLPFLYATLYSSKRVMSYVYFLTVVSTFIVVYGGYHFGLCDANMTLLTTKTLSAYVSDGHFTQTAVNNNPNLSLFLFFVLPRCLIYIAFMSVCNSIFSIVSGSIEKAKLTSELEKAKTEAERANTAKSQFLARMSHEIRTPINAIMGMNEMIISESGEDEIQKYADDIKISSQILLSIVNDILDSSKIESGKMELVPVKYHIGGFLNNLYNMISVRAKEKNLKLVFDIDPTIPKEYFGDEKRIRQVLTNLLTNAVKYTNKGTVTLKITCDVDGETAILHCSIKDTGIGIKAEDIEKIYDAYYRIDVSRNRNVEGSGLGMTIVQRLLELMGSELKIQSEYEKGSEFSFDIEQKIVNAKPVGDFRAENGKANGQRSGRTRYTAPEAKILVVDDNPMNLKVFKALLKNTKIQVSEAENGRKCLDILENQSFDVIFLDHMMPVMDGIETLHEIQRKKLCDGTPIIMLTANAISGDREKYISEGFDDFLTKPINTDKLDKMIINYLPDGLVKYSEDNAAKPAAEKTPAKAEEPVIAVPAETARQVSCAAEKTQEEILDELRESLPELNVESGMELCCNDTDFYLELFSDYVNLPIKDDLVRCLNDGNFKDYGTHIHGFKNNSYSVGADELGRFAFEMEKLAKAGNMDEIPEMQKKLFEMYDKVCSQYSKIISNG